MFPPVLARKATHFHLLVSALSQMAAPVATTSGKSPANISPSPKTAVPLRCDSEITSRVKAAPRQSKASFDCSRLALHLHRQKDY